MNNTVKTLQSIIPMINREYSLQTKWNNCDNILSLVQSFKKMLIEKLHPQTPLLYKLLVQNVVPYKIMPEKIRATLLKLKTVIKYEEYCEQTLIDKIYDNLSLENLREKIKQELGIKNEFTGLIITHDIDTYKGLIRSLRLKQVEELFDIESLWFIVANEYKLNKKIIRELADNAAIGSHDFKHDGKLYFLEINDIANRLSRSKHILENIVEKEVKWFRAPLLQFNYKIYCGAKKAGFTLASTSPTWEPLHPTLMAPYGIELIKPITICGVLEIPVSLIQDHQLLHILNLSPLKVIRFWWKSLEKIEKRRGLGVILIHSDYEFANKDYIDLYKSFLKRLVDEKSYLIIEPKKLICS